MNLFKKNKNAVMTKSRQNTENQFYDICQSDYKALDVEVLPEDNLAKPAQNSFLKAFRSSPSNYTGLGVQNLDNMDRHHSSFRSVQYDGSDFPFKVDEFDIVWSNAATHEVARNKIMEPVMTFNVVTKS